VQILTARINPCPFKAVTFQAAGLHPMVLAW
jgi:hypothetical protein